ncbi:MAG: glycosyltransferase [Nitrososphaeraceae archaeon]
MEILNNAIHIFFVISIIGILFTWVYFILFMSRSLSKSPMLSKFIQNKNKKIKFPKISIILPARNEEQYIKQCIDSLSSLNYPDYEIILVNDDSSDKTLELMQNSVHKFKNIKVTSTPKRPDGWMGKTWACYTGYLESSGDLLLFTDADTIHSRNLMSISVQYLLEKNLDAITIVPKLICKDLFTKITLPLFTIFLHTRFSPLKVNDPTSKVGYFFGSYFIISRNIYEKIGTHESVKNEIIEDGALGRKVKDNKFQMKMIRGEEFIDAVWARNAKELLNSIQRLVIPLFKESKINAVSITLFLFFVLLFPYFLLSYSIYTIYFSSDLLYLFVTFVTISVIILQFVTNIFHSPKTLFLNPLYSLGSPVGSFIIVLSFITGIIISGTSGIVNWRDRKYVISSSQKII